MPEIKPISHLRDLTSDPSNRRNHTPRGVGMIERGMGEVGAARSIVIDENGVVLAGNATIEAAAAAGIERVQVVDGDGETLVAVRRSGLTDDQKRKLAMYDNRTAELSDWNADQLLADVAAGVDLEQFFKKDELDEILRQAEGYGQPTEDPGADIDRAAELQKKWSTNLGQLWQIGRHRLLCGDCTVRENVERVMGGENAALMTTDPPYGVDYGELVGSRKNQKAGGWSDIANDSLSNEELLALLTVALDGCDSKIAFVWHPPGARRFLFWEALEANGWRVAQEIVWVKNALVFGRADYQWRHEPCMYCKRYGAGTQDDRTQTTVWEVDKPHDSQHPTQKPIELFTRPIANHTNPGDIVYDPFLGSGTTFVACEQLGRSGRGLEISPAYVAVCLERLAGMGLSPQLVEG